MTTPMLHLRIAGMGAFLPPNRVSSAHLEQKHDIPAGWIERATGVCERRVALSETSSGMAAMAARRALNRANIEGRDVDLIIGASAAPQQAVPCTAALVQRELGLCESGAPCFDLNATCLSFLFALHHASVLLEAGVYRNILIFSSEITSVSLNWRERESASLFGDAAVAVVVTRAQTGQSSALHGAKFRTDARGADFTQARGGGTLFHPNSPLATEQINQFSMQGPALFKMASRQMTPFLDEFFGELDWTREEIGAVVPHQASGFALAQLPKRFGFRQDQLIVNLPTRGNCVAASIPLALCEAIESGRIERADKVLLLGSGAGLSLGAMALVF